MTVLTKDQKKTYRTEYTENGAPCVLIATVRYDDDCNNGHNSFSITGNLYDRVDPIRGERFAKNTDGVRLWLGSGGCIHDIIAERIPELAPFIKWHLCSSDQPMHYAANAMYHAKAIPKEQGQYFAYLTDPVTGKKALLSIVDELKKQALIDTYGDKMSFEPHYNSMAKLANLEAARSSAIWPDAELSDFTLDKLNARLPQLMLDFRRDVELLQFIF